MVGGIVFVTDSWTEYDIYYSKLSGVLGNVNPLENTFIPYDGGEFSFKVYFFGPDILDINLENSPFWVKSDQVTTTGYYNVYHYNILKNYREERSAKFLINYTGADNPIKEINIKQQGTVYKPIFWPSPGTYNDVQSVKIRCDTDGADIYYTTDESEPTQSSILYTELIRVDHDMIIKARAYKDDWNPSNVVTGEYFITQTGTVATPTFSPPPGTYASAQNVTISCSTSGATIRYTTNGSNPTDSSPVYSSPINISSTTTLKARAYKSGWAASSIATGSYTITGTITLTVSSINPDNGVTIIVPPDINGQGNGVTQFNRRYNKDDNISLEAPDIANGNSFKQWSRDGSFYTTDRTISSMKMDKDYEMTAIYEHPNQTNPPTTVTATKGQYTQFIGIKWDRVSDGYYYKLFRNDVDNPGQSSAITNWQSSNSYMDRENAEAGKLYYYWVKAAINSNGDNASGFSRPDSGFRKLAKPNLNEPDVISSSQIDLSWDDIEGETHYMVYYKKSSENDYIHEEIDQVSANKITFSKTGLDPGTSYDFKIRAFSSSSKSYSEYSNIVSETTHPNQISPPTNVMSTKGLHTDKIVVTWDANNSATYCQVFRGEENNTSSSYNISDWQTENEYQDKNATPGTKYYYWVKAATNSNGDNESGFSNSDYGFRKLATPRLNEPVVISSSQIDLSWDYVEGSSFYFIHYKKSSDNIFDHNNHDQIPAGKTNFQKTGLEPGTSYDFKILAYSLSSNSYSEYSDISSETTHSNQISAPNNITATEGVYPDKIVISWDASNDATHYQVFRGEENNTLNVIPITGWQNDLTFSDKPPLPGKNYYYWVKAASNQNGENGSGLSQNGTGWMKLKAPSVISVSQGTFADKIEISWQPVVGANYYRVFRSNNPNIESMQFRDDWKTETSYNDYSVVKGTNYYYTIKSSINQDGDRPSDFSEIYSGYLSTDSQNITGYVYDVFDNGVENATITMNEQDSTLTNSQGYFSFINNYNDGLVIKAKKYFDELYARAYITSSDALGILRHTAFINRLENLFLTAADVDKDQLVNNADAMKILRFCAYKDVNIGFVGNWEFIPPYYYIALTDTFSTPFFDAVLIGNVIQNSPSLLKNENGASFIIKEESTNNNSVKNISILLSNSIENINSLQFILKYDQSVLSPVNIKMDESMQTWIHIEHINSQESQINFALCGLTAVQINKSIYTIEFKVISEVSNSTLLLNNIIIDDNKIPDFSLNMNFDEVNEADNNNTIFNIFPNPFNAHLTINYQVHKSNERENVVIEIYDILGRKVNTLFTGKQSAGSYSKTWGGKDESGHSLASGIFFINVKIGNKNHIKKVGLLR
ncbi:chitobiase/beta-hexosaminidase C-terminal domain-containing protein [candidate division KSB1 bacterium]|nr:chitobiase/beta-hexosaminidase C-terminal domain-containing protein [candidate division KSB1 bacterium]